MTITMYDSIIVSTVPSNPQAVAGYVGGSWPDFSALVRAFPRAHHLSIAVNSGEDAECLDVETGDATPWEAPGWVARQIRRGVNRPVLYANASTMPSVVSALSNAGFKRSQYRLWIAHFTYVEPKPPFEQGADAVQWTDRALNRNLDQNICLDTFFNAPAPPVVNPNHYDWFPKGPFPSEWGSLNEQAIVLAYDKYRKHPLLYKVQLKKLQAKLQFLADRVYTVASRDRLKDGKRSWNKFHRGWRYQQLVHRAQGHRFV